MRLDKFLGCTFVTLALLTLVGMLIFTGLKTTHINIRSNPRDRAGEISAASRARVDEMQAESQARVSEMRAESWAQMAQAYAQSVLVESEARADATLKQASADAMQTRSMAMLPWALIAMVLLVVIVMLFRRQQSASEGKSVVLILPPGASRQDLQYLLASLQPDQVRRLPAPDRSDRAIILREDR